MLHPTIFSSFPHVVAWFSTREDLPEPLLSSWSRSVADVALARNHISDLLFWSCSCAFMSQAHTDRVVQVCDVGCPTVACDALFTGSSGIPLSVYVADCVPILLYLDAPTTPMVAVAHLGRRWARSGLLSSLLHSLLSVYPDPSSLYVYVWPHICAWCYVFGSEAYTLFESSYINVLEGSIYVDITSMVVDAFLRQGVLRDHLEISSFCTYENADSFFSYRKNKGTNRRMFGMIWLVS